MTGPLALPLALLGPPAGIYGILIRLRNEIYDRSWGTTRAGVPVISVGNLTVGGTGKTPLVAWIARLILSEGFRPAVVSRGYRGSAGRGPLLVSEGSGPLVGPGVAGDEPYLLARTLPEIRVVVGSDRVAGAQEAHRAGAEVVILDDGFQHRRLARDLDIVLLDAEEPFGNFRLLPAGPLREPLRALARADIIVITRWHHGQSVGELQRSVRRHNSRCLIARAVVHRVGFVDPTGNPIPAPRKALAFCGIGNPRGFRSDLEAEGLDLVGFRAFADHHPYSITEMRALTEEARRLEVALVTTEKDLVRLPIAAGRGSPRLAALRIESRIEDGETVRAAVRAMLRRASA